MTRPRQRHAAEATASWPFVAMAGSLAGAALQLQQAALWHGVAYAAMLCAGVAGLALLRRGVRRGVVGVSLLLLFAAALLCGAFAGGGLAGWRAAAYAASALDPALEGRDLQLVGVVAQMPQRNDAGLRFQFEVESARWADADGGKDQGKDRGKDDADERPAPRVPARLSLGWYATSSWGRAAEEGGASRPDLGAAPGPLHAGERWRLTVRLKAPHGNFNPHGFDTELWLWGQGVRASGYVRSGPRDAAPVRIAGTWRHPVERAREAVRDAAFERVAERRLAGVIAALVTGDQSAIERVDWDIFRITGVAHLMAISGLHITMCACV